MALKSMIKLGDKVSFGRAGGMKTAGNVVKLNPKTAHIKTSDGEEFAVPYDLIQKPPSPGSRKAHPPKKTHTRRTQRKFPSWMTEEDFEGYNEMLGGGMSHTAVMRRFNEARRRELAEKKKKNPTPYKFGAASKKLRRATKQDDDFGDPVAFASTYPDEYEHMTTREYEPERTRPNPARAVHPGQFKSSYKMATSPTSGYEKWLAKQTKTELRKLEKAYTALLQGQGRIHHDVKIRTQHQKVKAELRRRE